MLILWAPSHYFIVLQSICYLISSISGKPMGLVMPFNAHQLPWETERLVIGTSKTKYLKDDDIGAAVQSYRGATIRDLLQVVRQYPPLNIRSVTVIAGFNDNRNPKNKVILYLQQLIGLITYKFQPLTNPFQKLFPQQTTNRSSTE